MRNLYLLFFVVFISNVCLSNDSIKVEKLLSLAEEYNNYDSTLYYANKALETSDSIQYLSQHVRILHIIGATYHRKGMFQNALKAGYKALKHCRRLDDTLSQAIILNNIAKSYSSLGNEEKAISICREALSLLEDTYKENEVVFLLLMKIGNAYFDSGDLKMALKFHKRALGIADNLDTPIRKIRVLNAVGLTHLQLEQDSLALSYFEQAIKINKVPNISLNALGTSFYNMGVLHEKNGHLDEALHCFIKVSEYWSNYPDRLYSIYLNIGNLYREIGQFDSAIPYLNKVEELSLNTKDTQNKSLHVGFIGGNVGYPAYPVKEYKKAHSHFEKAQVLNDSIINEENSNITKAGYNARQERDSILILNKQAQINQQKTIILSFVTTTVGLLFVLWFINKNRRKEKKRRIVQEELNKLLSEKAKEFEKINSQLLTDIKFKGKKLQIPEPIDRSQVSHFTLNLVHLTSGKKPLIRLGDIYYVEAQNNFVLVVTETNKYREWQRLKDMGELLPEQLFVRIHKSYIINLLKIKSVLPKKVILTNGKEINVTKTYQESFRAALDCLKS